MSRVSKYVLTTLAGLSVWLLPVSAASAMPDCEWLANRMETQLALPAGLLASIAEVEAGRKQADGSMKPWPWTINHAGKGLFFETEKDALAYAEKHIETGDVNLDLGCMQLSVKWHLDRFSDPAQMLDPVSNVAYAASFLEQLYQRHGSWDEAVRRYHNADHRQSNPYLQKVRAVWKQEPEPSQKVAVASASSPAPVLPAGQPDRANPSHIASPAPRPQLDKLRALVKKAASGAPVQPDMAAPARPATAAQNRVETKHPSLAGQWDKIARFRKILAEQDPPSS